MKRLESPLLVDENDFRKPYQHRSLRETVVTSATSIMSRLGMVLTTSIPLGAPTPLLSVIQSAVDDVETVLQELLATFPESDEVLARHQQPAASSSSATTTTTAAATSSHGNPKSSTQASSFSSSSPSGKSSRSVEFLGDPIGPTAAEKALLTNEYDRIT